MMAKKPSYEKLEQRVKELEKEAAKSKAAEEALRVSEKRLTGIVIVTKDNIDTYADEVRKITDRIVSDIKTKYFLPPK